MDLYKRKYIALEVIKGATGRDFSALGKNNANIRALRVRNIFELERALKLINWDKNKQNLYRGLATLSEIPDFTFNPRKRSDETIKWFTKEYCQSIIKYDLFLDFDKAKKCPECDATDSQANGLKKKDENFLCLKCDKEFLKKDIILSSIEDVIEDVKIIKEYLDEYKVSYVLLFSGNKGFQIVVDGDYLPIKKIEMGNIYPHKTIAEKLKVMLNLKYLDSANTGVYNRLMKIPYSLVPNGETDEQEMNMALPLTDEQFENFNIEDMKAKNVLSKCRMIRRGNLERHSELSLRDKMENLQNFIKLFAF